MAKRANTSGRRATFPVANLREQVSALESAIAQVLARAKQEPVHELRKATRRIEAQLELIAALARQEPGFAAAEKPARRVRKLLGKVRKAAGGVRDLDVQRKLAKDATADGAARRVRAGAKRLRLELKVERRHEAKVLVKLLQKHALKLEPRLEELMQALEPVAEVGLSGVELEVLTRGWYKSHRADAEHERQPEQQMHGIRKAAKLARYMAQDGAAARVQDEFEAVQDAGGRWHDALTLRDIARSRLGKHSDLAALLDKREEATRSEYQALLYV